MGYFDNLNKYLDEYLCINYSEDEEIQALLDTYQEGELPELELFEAVDREILYEFMETQEWYSTLTEEELNEILGDDYINYFMDCSLSEAYRYYDEIDIKTVLLQTDIYKYDDMYYLVWEIH